MSDALCFVTEDRRNQQQMPTKPNKAGAYCKFVLVQFQ